MNYGTPFWRDPDPMGRQQPRMTVPTMPGGLPGRVIQNPNEIVPGEVEMNGKVSLFPMADYSSIIAKCWNQYGTIDTVRYIPEPQQQQPAMLPQGQQNQMPNQNQPQMQEPQVIYQQMPDETQKELLTRLTNIEQCLAQVMQAQMNSQQTQSLQSQENKKGGKT